MSTLGHILKQLRHNMEGKPTQEDVAKAIGYPRATYANWEIGRGEPDHDALRALSKYFNCTIDYLLGRTPNPQQFYINDTSEYLSEEEREFVIKNKPLIMTTKDAVNKTSPEKIKQLLKLVIDLDKENP